MPLRQCDQCGTKVPPFRPRKRQGERLLCDGCHPKGRGSEARPVGYHGSLACEDCNEPISATGLKVVAGRFVCPDGCRKTADDQAWVMGTECPECAAMLVYEDGESYCIQCGWSIKAAAARVAAYWLGRVVATDDLGLSGGFAEWLKEMWHDFKSGGGEVPSWFPKSLLTEEERASGRFKTNDNFAGAFAALTSENDGWLFTEVNGPTLEDTCEFPGCDKPISGIAFVGDRAMAGCAEHCEEAESMMALTGSKKCSRCNGRGRTGTGGGAHSCRVCKGTGKTSSRRIGWCHDCDGLVAEIKSEALGTYLFCEKEGKPVEAKRVEMLAPVAALRKQAHDSGDGETIYHCPFCGAGQVTGRSDGTVECGFCHTFFTVQVQPQHPNMPQTVNGQPVQMPGMPGDPTQQVGPSPEDVSVHSIDDLVVEPAGAVEDQSVVPGIQPESALYVTAQGVLLPEDKFLKHLALACADDRDAVLEEIRGAT